MSIRTGGRHGGGWQAHLRGAPPNIPGNPTPAFPGTFAADGTFSGQIIAGTIFGRVQGSHMEGRIDGSGCLYTFMGERI